MLLHLSEVQRFRKRLASTVCEIESTLENHVATEGNLEAPTRHALDWQGKDFYNEESCFNELERIFDICHGCRRCVSLCGSFPTLFDLVDESSTMEVDGVDKKTIGKW